MKETKRRKKVDEKKLTLVQHLEELRQRIIICLAAIFICGVLSFFYADKILVFLIKPVGNLVFLRPEEAFFAKIKVAFFTGIFLSLPIIIYNIWRFISPALFLKERKLFFRIIIFSYIFFICGVNFAFFLIVPPAIKFLLTSGTEKIVPMISVNYYLSFILFFLLAFGIVFQLPLVNLSLIKLNIISPEFLKKKRKYVILVIFILSGILTPGPDIFSQFLMAVPALIMYELSIIFSKLIK